MSIAGRYLENNRMRRDDDETTSEPMSDELALAARAAQDLAPHVREVAQATGLLEPIQQLVGRLADRLYISRQVAAAELLMDAAKKISATGLPTRAVADRYVRAVLEDGAFEDDREMRERWANLLANAATCTDAATTPLVPHVAFPRILAEIEPIEARMLDAMHAALDDEVSGDAELHRSVDGFGPAWFTTALGIDRFRYATAAANLARLELVRWTGRNDPPHVLLNATRQVVSGAIQLTQFGSAFVNACQPPGQATAVPMLISSEPE